MRIICYRSTAQRTMYDRSDSKARYEALGVSATNKSDQLAEAERKLNCRDEKCVLRTMENVLGVERVTGEIASRIKVEGPTDVTLLNNVNIDNVMRQWMYAFPDFFAYNFNMLNYATHSYHGSRVLNTPDTLATIGFDKLMREGYRKAGCIINSDVYQGPGEHWMALFADAQNGTVEFYNSSGNAPAPEWINWMMKTRDMIGPTAEIVRVTKIRHQQSKSECGPFSLFYVWARLHGVPPSYFATTTVPDQLMFEFRQHLFGTARKPTRFDYDAFKAEVTIKWENN